MFAVPSSWGFAGLVSLALVVSEGATPENTAVTAAHVRVLEPELVALIDEGTARSRTFRLLIERINDTDGIVYLQSGACSIGAAAACLLLKVTQVAGARYLHIHVTRQLTHREDRIAIIGHELQHADEVLSSRWVRNTKDAYALFTRIGSAGSIRSFETDEAQRVQRLIAAELADPTGRTIR